MTFLEELLTEIPARIIEGYCESRYSRLDRYCEYCHSLGTWTTFYGQYSAREQKFFYPEEMEWVHKILFRPAAVNDIQFLFEMREGEVNACGVGLLHCLQSCPF